MDLLEDSGINKKIPDGCDEVAFGFNELFLNFKLDKSHYTKSGLAIKIPNDLIFDAKNVSNIKVTQQKYEEQIRKCFRQRNVNEPTGAGLAGLPGRLAGTSKYGKGSTDTKWTVCIEKKTVEYRANIFPDYAAFSLLFGSKNMAQPSFFQHIIQCFWRSEYILTEAKIQPFRHRLPYRALGCLNGENFQCHKLFYLSFCRVDTIQQNILNDVIDYYNCTIDPSKTFYISEIMADPTACVFKYYHNGRYDFFLFFFIPFCLFKTKSIFCGK